MLAIIIILIGKHIPSINLYMIVQIITIMVLDSHNCAYKESE
jgi:hypothetical protein